VKGGVASSDKCHVSTFSTLAKDNFLALSVPGKKSAIISLLDCNGEEDSETSEVTKSTSASHGCQPIARFGPLQGHRSKDRSASLATPQKFHRRINLPSSLIATSDTKILEYIEATGTDADLEENRMPHALG
jgi:hypothetical protein